MFYFFFFLVFFIPFTTLYLLVSLLCIFYLYAGFKDLLTVGWERSSRLGRNNWYVGVLAVLVLAAISYVYFKWIWLW